MNAMKRRMLIPLLALLSLGCATSEAYKIQVSRTYPVIATRMDGYELTDEQAAKVKELRDVSADRKLVRYETARPAWEAVAPEYRQLVAADVDLSEQRRADWLHTADSLDRHQASELKYRQTLGLSPPPPP